MLAAGTGTKRRHERYPTGAPVEVHFQGTDGLFRRLKGKSVDVSESGIQVELAESVPLHMYVTLKAPAMRLHGSASVRYVRPRGLKYRAGLEFSGGMRWK